MFGQMLRVQWRWARLELFLYALAALLIPILMVKIASTYLLVLSPQSTLEMMSTVGVFYVALAVVCAVGLSARPWTVDASGSHVYALSLPLPWSSFVRLRFLAGATLLAVPTLAVWMGGLIATASTQIPVTLHAYPGGVAIRFLLSALVLYAALFFLQYTAGKNAPRVVIYLFFAAVAAELFGRLFGFGSAMIWTWNVITTSPGPFETLTARWMLIDV